MGCAAGVLLIQLRNNAKILAKTGILGSASKAFLHLDKEQIQFNRLSRINLCTWSSF